MGICAANSNYRFRVGFGWLLIIAVVAFDVTGRLYVVLNRLAPSQKKVGRVCFCVNDAVVKTYQGEQKMDLGING